MADLVKVTRASDGEEIIVDIDTAIAMKNNNELTIPADNNGLSSTDVFGADYESTGTFTGV